MLDANLADEQSILDIICKQWRDHEGTPTVIGRVLVEE
jgi:hypothetical protein